MIETTCTRSPPTEEATSPQTLVEETMVSPEKDSSVASVVESVAAQPARRRTVAVARARVLDFIATR